MRTSLVLAGALAGAFAASIAAVPGHAQSSASTAGNGSVLQVTPYAGYMRFGDYITGPLGTSVTNAGAPVYGAQLGLKLAPNVSLVGNIGYARSDMEIDLPFVGNSSVGRSTLLIYDGGLQFDVPSSALPIAPFLQAGIGAIRYDLDQSFVQVQATNLAGNVGIGADVPLGRSAALRVMAKDYIGRFDFADDARLGLEGRTAHNWAFTAGLRLDF